MTHDTSGLTDGSLAECSHDRFERNHYFHGKLMTARDMAAEQRYHAGHQRAHARNVAGAGVAWGLGAKVKSGDGALEVTVKRGYAIDECGRPVVVPQDRVATIDDPDVLGASTVTVSLAYEACLKESVPVSGAGTACDDECAYNRVLEVYDVEITPGTPDAVEKPVPHVAFPGLDDFDGREQPDETDPELSTIASTYRESVGQPGADPDAATVFVGVFEEGSDAEWDQLEEWPTGFVYTNDMLYAAVARHAADFENPHEVTLSSEATDDGNGATVAIADDESDAPEVTVTSADESVDVVHGAPQTIDFSIESRLTTLLEETLPGLIDERAQTIVDDLEQTLVTQTIPTMIDEQAGTMIEKRVEPLERYAVEQALKYKGLVFRAAANEFEAPTAMRVSMLARAAVDDRLGRETDAAAAEYRKLRIVLDGQPSLRIYEEDVYVDMLTDFLADERTVADEVESQVTPESHDRLVLALDRLEAALDAEEPTTLRIAAAQDDVCDAVEWLAPVADEPEEETTTEEETQVETTTVPDVEGQTEENAESTLADNQLSADVTYQQISKLQQLREFAYGEVMGQSPAANTEVEVDSTVQLAVLVSAPLTVLSDIGDKRAAQFSKLGIDWLHELVSVDAGTLASKVGSTQARIEEWQAEAEEYLLAIELHLREGISLQEALDVVGAFDGLATGTIATMTDQQLHDAIDAAVNDGTLDDQAAQYFANVSDSYTYYTEMTDHYVTTWDDVTVNY